jgi:hypothetical protein
VELSLSVLLALLVLALVACSIRPDLSSVPVLLVFEPVSLVLSAVSVVVPALAVCLVVLPLSVVNVSVCVNESAPAVGLVIFPVALVYRAVDPDLDTLAVLHVGLLVPLSLVLGAVCKFNLRLPDSPHAVVRLLVVLEWF